MDLKNAEWVIREYEQGNYSFEEDVLNKARNILKQSPYVTYECEFCDVPYTSRKNSDEEINKLCHKCYLRMGNK